MNAEVSSESGQRTFFTNNCKSFHYLFIKNSIGSEEISEVKSENLTGFLS